MLLRRTERLSTSAIVLERIRTILITLASSVSILALSFALVMMIPMADSSAHMADNVQRSLTKLVLARRASLVLVVPLRSGRTEKTSPNAILTVEMRELVKRVSKTFSRYLGSLPAMLRICLM